MKTRRDKRIYKTKLDQKILVGFTFKQMKFMEKISQEKQVKLGKLIRDDVLKVNNYDYSEDKKE